MTLTENQKERVRCLLERRYPVQTIARMMNAPLSAIRIIKAATVPSKRRKRFAHSTSMALRRRYVEARKAKIMEAARRDGHFQSIGSAVPAGGNLVAAGQDERRQNEGDGAGLS